MSGGQYSVLVADNNNVGGQDQDGDGSATTDSDLIFRLKSTGKIGNTEQVVEAFYRINKTSNVTLPSPPSSCEPAATCDSAALICGTTGDIETQGASVINGNDHGVPGYGCTGAACNMPDTTSGNWDVIAENTATLSCTGGSCSTDLLQNNGNNANCDDWKTFYDNWASYSGSSSNVVHLSGSSYTGTGNNCSTPKIYILDTTSSTYSITGNVFLCGAFIIKSNTQFQTSGTITMAGLMLMMGNNSNLAYNSATGTSNFYGKVVIRSTTADTQKEIYTQGNNSLFFSKEGIDYGLQAFKEVTDGPTTPTISLENIAWRTSSK